MATVKGITYYDQGETPGLGGEVGKSRTGASSLSASRCWMTTVCPALKVVKRRRARAIPHAVDGLSGATLTSNGVQHSLISGMGELGFGPFLKKVREGELNNG